MHAIRSAQRRRLEQWVEFGKLRIGVVLHHMVGLKWEATGKDDGVLTAKNSASLAYLFGVQS